MASKKMLLLGLSLTLAITTINANVIKGFNNLIKGTIESTLGKNYGHAIAATLITAGGIYTLYNKRAYNNQKKLFEDQYNNQNKLFEDHYNKQNKLFEDHKKKLSPHEQLQDHYDHLLKVMETYSPYALQNGTHAQRVQHVCAVLEDNLNNEAQLNALHTQAAADAAQLSADHDNALTVFAAVETDQHLAPLALQREHFSDLYDQVQSTLTCLISQIRYAQAKLFLETYKELSIELELKNCDNSADLINQLHDIIHSRRHGSRYYPYRSYEQWLSTVQSKASELEKLMKDFDPQPFQRETVSVISELTTVLSLISTRIRGSKAYKKECKAYAEECHREAVEAARRREAEAKAYAEKCHREAVEAARKHEAAMKYQLEQQKLDQLKRQTDLLERKEQRDQAIPMNTPYPPAYPPSQPYNPESSNFAPSAPPQDDE